VENEASEVKSLAVSNLFQILGKRSHDDELAFKSDGYGDFRPVFREVATNGAPRFIANLLGGRPKTAKPKFETLNSPKTRSLFRVDDADGVSY
jgi:hypothetical protein